MGERFLKQRITQTEKKTAVHVIVSTAAMRRDVWFFLIELK